ncbi:stage II sporulation protein M [Thermodesulfitimonas sp.]
MALLLAPLLAFLLSCPLSFGYGLWLGVRDARQLDTRDALRLEQYIAPAIRGDGHHRRDVFHRAALRNLLPLGAMYVAGLTVIGMPVVAGILLLRGYALGFTGGFLVSRKGLYGLGVLLAAVLPQNIILLLVFVVGAVASFSFSLLLLQRWFNSEVVVLPWFLRYTGLMALLAAAAVGAGLVEAYVVPGLAHMIVSSVKQ